VAMGWPLEQPHALDEFLESRHRLAFAQLHVFVPRLAWADTIVNLRLPVLNESDAEEGFANGLISPLSDLTPWGEVGCSTCRSEARRLRILASALRAEESVEGPCASSESLVGSSGSV
jgi:hypothetical protein